jgi:hypothetical protein
VSVDLDKDGGNLVSMTIEHAARVASPPGISLEEIGAGAAQPAAAPTLQVTDQATRRKASSSAMIVIRR